MVGGGSAQSTAPLRPQGCFGVPRGRSLPALISLSVWFMMNLSGATQKSLVPCGGGDETEHGGGREGSELPPPQKYNPHSPPPPPCPGPRKPS